MVSEYFLNLTSFFVTFMHLIYFQTGLKIYFFVSDRIFSKAVSLYTNSKFFVNFGLARQVGLPLVMILIRWHSISMRVGPAVLRSDWSRAGLSKDLPVFVYSHTRTGLKLLLRQGRCLCHLSIWLQVFQRQTIKTEP